MSQLTINTLTFRTPTTPAANLPKQRRARLLVSDNSGVRFYYDSANPFSWAKNAAPVNGDVVKDISENADGNWSIASGQAIGWNNCGFDFSVATAPNDSIALPSTVAADIWGPGSGATLSLTVTGGVITGAAVTAGGSGYTSVPQAVVTGAGSGAAIALTVAGGVITGATVTAGGTGYTTPTGTVVPQNQYALAVAYLKLPTAANWETAAGIVAPLIGWGTVVTTDMLTVGFSVIGGVNYIQTYRQTVTGTWEITSLVPLTADYGSFAQIAAWRDATGLHLRLRTANATTSAAVIAGGKNNITNFSTRPGFVGYVNLYGATGNFGRFQLYAGWVENLLRSGRDPVTTLDADYTRMIGRPAGTYG